jgi:hypothetical protein
MFKKKWFIFISTSLSTSLCTRPTVLFCLLRILKKIIKTPPKLSRVHHQKIKELCVPEQTNTKKHHTKTGLKDNDEGVLGATKNDI